MNILNQQFLQTNRDAYTETINAGTAKKAFAIKNDLLRIIREEWFPGYVYNEDCGPCIFDLVRIVYRQYDEWVLSHVNTVTPSKEEWVKLPKDNDEYVIESSIRAGKTEASEKWAKGNGAEIITKATYPSHKNHHRK